ncbi:MAG: hypothetical protein K0S09_366 [Sphingobacteriaceae bacterium]|jgi:hypothetical protein|nr:hypothetical protein [Sphingobacteriaceae bacterium]
MMFRRILAVVIAVCVWATVVSAQSRYAISPKNGAITIRSGAGTYTFTADFTILFTEKNPDMALRPAGIEGVPYNVPTWKTYPGKASDLKKTNTTATTAGDGFDDKIIRSNQSGRTSSIVNGAQTIAVTPTSVSRKGDTITFNYKSSPLFNFSAKMVLSATQAPVLRFSLKPLTKGFYSVGYNGAPMFKLKSLKEIWQPLIWQEMRFPDRPYLTPAHMATLPVTLSFDGKSSVGVMAAPKHLPFEPLPLLINSQFGIALRNEAGDAQSAIFAPILGGYKSEMAAGSIFNFDLFLIAEPQNITRTYEKLAREYFGFKDYRHNDISTLNQTLDNITSYALSKYTWFVDSLKGFAYSTDVPGAVKNVSSLNPLELAILTDKKEMFDTRAYPLMEYMLSREKFLFSLDSAQKIQNPSRKLSGPVAPISELVALYNIFNKQNPLFVAIAKNEFAQARERNLDVKENGDSWMNAMHLYRATGDKTYLQKAIAGADEYIKVRVDKPQLAFDDKFAGGVFFWTSYTNKWIDLLQLYELTGSKQYLDAAHEGARHYAMYAYMAPAIPDSSITVNKGGKAPMYWYLQSKGHKQMYYPEEKAPAWRLSEIGLTPESSGTSSGHRAIFMTNYAPWMLKLGYYTNDAFLKEVAKSAVIGRYRNFPGYHINTERTTAYEKLDFPLHEFKDQSVSSFHFNHILPMASMLVDYLVTDAFVRSGGKIAFPAEFIEGYAYLQSNFYGAKPGSFYSENNVQLWMPSGLVKTSDVELNYIAGRRGNSIFIAFMNQSSKPVNSSVAIDQSLVHQADSPTFSVLKGDKWLTPQALASGMFNISVAPNGLTVVRIDQVLPQVMFQDKLLANISAVRKDMAEIDLGKAQAFIFRLGEVSKAYVYLREDDSKFSDVTMIYKLKDGKSVQLNDKAYPFEFTVDLPETENAITIQLLATKKNGEKVKSGIINLGDK